MGFLPDTYVHDWLGMQRNFTAISQRFQSGNGPPDATDRGPLGAQYVDEQTGNLYVLKSTGWKAVTTT